MQRKDPTTQVRIRTAHRDALQKIAEAERRTFIEVASVAIEKYLAEYQKKVAQ